MSRIMSHYHYPTDIKLAKNSLAEAWLEIRLVMDESPLGNGGVDSGFDFALGVFSQLVKPEFPTRIALDASKFPSQMLPYVVRYQFRRTQDSWPLFQIGPGIAAVNFTQPYSWELFQEKAKYLRSALVNAYDQKIAAQSVFLRYRNAIPFDYKKQDMLDFLASNLHINIKHPSNIPGFAGNKSILSDLNVGLAFELKEPKGKGAIKIATGQKVEPAQHTKEDTDYAIIFELEVASEKPDVPEITDESKFETWLNQAHSAIHDWYFSLIEGDLRKRFESGEE